MNTAPPVASPRLRAYAVAAVLSICLGACEGDESASDGRTLLQRWSAPGSACVFPEHTDDIEFDPVARFIEQDHSNLPEVALDADAPLTVRIYARKPCSLDVELRCSVKLQPEGQQDGGGGVPVLVVTAEMDGYDDGSTECSREIVFVSADCPTPPLPAGFYDFKYGDEQGFIDLPAVRSVQCTEDASQELLPLGATLD